jgi:hypothetical protein
MHSIASNRWAFADGWATDALKYRWRVKADQEVLHYREPS